MESRCKDTRWDKCGREVDAKRGAGKRMIRGNIKRKVDACLEEGKEGGMGGRYKRME